MMLVSLYPSNRPDIGWDTTGTQAETPAGHQRGHSGGIAGTGTGTPSGQEPGHCRRGFARCSAWPPESSGLSGRPKCVARTQRGCCTCLARMTLATGKFEAGFAGHPSLQAKCTFRFGPLDGTLWRRGVSSLCGCFASPLAAVLHYSACALVHSPGDTWMHDDVPLRDPLLVCVFRRLAVLGRFSRLEAVGAMRFSQNRRRASG